VFCSKHFIQSNTMTQQMEERIKLLEEEEDVRENNL
jgi:hypothetical protein